MCHCACEIVVFLIFLTHVTPSGAGPAMLDIMFVLGLSIWPPVIRSLGEANYNGD